MSDEPQPRDPSFAEAKAIRRGERDDQLPNYDVIEAWLLRVPRTWQGALIRTLVSREAIEPFFKDDAALMTFIERSRAAVRDPLSMLRTTPPPNGGEA